LARMHPGNKNWLKEYMVDTVPSLYFQIDHNLLKRGGHPDQTLYSILQPTGLMYGLPFHGIHEEEPWSQEQKMKVLLLESLVHSALVFQGHQYKNEEEFSSDLEAILGKIGVFYNSIYPDISVSTKSFFGTPKEPMEITERLLERRIAHKRSSKDNFWTNFFHNSLLFLDVFLFGRWINASEGNGIVDFLQMEKEEMRFTIVKVMTAASHANNFIEKEERNLFEFFIDSTDLNAIRKREALRYFEQGVTLDSLDLRDDEPWIIRKYLLELALLTTWADKQVETSETHFLENFSRVLGFHGDELENSMIAVEGFVLDHWEEFDYLQNKQSYFDVSEKFIARLASLISRNTGRLKSEIRSDKKLMELLQKATFEQLSDREKQEIAERLVMTLKAIPSLSIIHLPHHFLTFPVMMKAFDKDFFSGVL
jgi:hypothetical protein